MQEKPARGESANRLIESEAVSWWSWKPGMKPLYALLLGGVLSLTGLFLLLNSGTALILNVLDSVTPAQRVPGIVVGHSQTVIGSQQVTIRLATPGFPTEISLVVPSNSLADLANGTHIVVEYATHQRLPYALESAGKRIVLSGTLTPGIVSLLIFSLLLLPYPLLLSFWGWRDLRTRQTRQIIGSVVALREAKQTTRRTPGLVPRITSTWYGIALQAENGQSASEPEIFIFGVQQEMHKDLQRGDRVMATYSPHLRHLYALKHLKGEGT